MANQDEPKLPLSNSDERKTSDLLPRFYRTDSNKKFFSATLDQLLQPGKAKKITGYVGRKNSKAAKASDVFISGTDNNRENYQLEPVAVIQDYLGNTNFYKDYVDHINHIDVAGGNVTNHERLNKQEFYSWNPHICWDKFVNFQQYYWLPYGPASLEVQGQQQDIESTYTITIEDQGDNYVYLFNSLSRNPTLTLYRGQTYYFEISANNNPFTIKTTRVAGELEKYTNGVSASSVTNGVITFKVPLNSPDVLFYVSEADANTGGVFEIKDIDENAFLDVTADVLGKKTYTLSSGTELTNGMKLFFTGVVVPEQYATGYWYVEGVGSSIKLVSSDDLEIISDYSQETSLLFDDEPFDASPFSTLTSFPRDKDYVLVNRASPDRNQWARYNRWFHQDVVIATAKAQGVVPELDQAQRAIRPIIEFEAGVKLFNFGHKAKLNVDLIDTFTTDVFSTIEGTLGYNIDGVDVSDGMRILFTADTDRFVNDKIYKVKFLTVTNPGRQIEFNALLGIDIANNIITCTTPHGLTTGNQITYLNNGNDSVDGLVNRKIYYAFVVNNTQLRLFTDKSLSVRADIFATGNGAHKLEVFSGLSRQINLVEESDAQPLLNETVLVNRGFENQGTMYWYNGTTWKLGQRKTTINQPPLFDIFDNNGNSYGDTLAYDGSNFAGTKLFSYKIGTGSNDTALGFPLSYRNVSNTGDIVFEFNLLNDSFNYKQIAAVLTKNTNIGFLKIVKDLASFNYQNGWTTSEIANSQPIVRVFKESGLLNNFPLDMYDFKDNLDDLEIKVYINGRRQNKETFAIVDGVARKSVVLTTAVTADDIVTLKCYSSQPKNENGYYEIPLNLQNNPLNNDISQFTLGEVIDHVDSIVENINGFSGAFPGYSNLRNLGNLTAYGTRFVQHSGPLNLSLYHFGSKTANVLKGLNQSRQDYGKFKRAFITLASESGIDTDPRRHVDYILEELSKDKTKTQPYYLSDMFAHSGAVRSEYVVLDVRVKTYPLITAFNLNSLTNRAVNIYVNEQQLVHGRDYIFGSENFFEIKSTLAEGDIIEAFEFETTDGSFCPATPTKLGLYPAFEPSIYVDNSYLEPTQVIQGHDGSITVAYNDYRDELILELEKRIFNNIKIKYDASIFDIYEFIPGYSRETDYSKEEFDLVLSQYFFDWTTNISQDYTKQDNTLWDRLNPFTWNYRNNSFPDSRSTPAFWRGIYRWTLDTDRPHTHPWECLGFSIQPSWWTSVYGPVPYTKDNFILWDDIKNGIIREPGFPIRTLPRFAKSILASGYPVNESGELVAPYDASHVEGYINPTAEGFYTFGDVGPVESAWRRSSYYAFALIQTALLLKPNHVLATCLDRSRIVRNLNNQLVYADTGLRIRLADIKLPSTALSSTRTITSGLINYIIDYISSDTTLLVTEYASNLSLLTNNIGSKLGGFTSKPKFKLLLDSKSIASSGGVFVPEENYQIVSNVSSPIKKIVYSGIAITKYPDGYEVRGYNIDQPYFTYYPYTLPGKTINVGGMSESYSVWETNKYYVVGKIVRSSGLYYRVKVSHTSDDTFNTSNFTRIAELPITGGRDAELRRAWDTGTELNIGYGTKFTTIQSIVDFIQGYGVYLEKQGFVFDEYNDSLRNINNWESAIKEFLFWTTQNWAVGAVISLSPAANSLVLNTTDAVVNDIKDKFFEYKIFRVDGQKLDSDFINTFREGGKFVLTPSNTNYGIYGASLYLVQKEHVVLLDNSTLFNDIIYDLEPGYRQERIKVLGYISTNWTGGYNIPGFIYDQARLQDWEPWTDYNLGDIVKYKEFYYSASVFLVGTENFESSNWIRLEEKPEAQLLPNWEYKTMQFTDFYSLDSDNFDTGQQKMAQHLIGYQKRQYLENIIQDDVSQYKFYQGMIIEKGTQNVFSKLFDVLSADNQESLTFNEEWAIRVGNYGSTAIFDEIEFKLDESKFKLNPQPFELTSSIDSSVVDFVYRQVPSDVYIKPVGYNNNPWPMVDTAPYLRTPGYVRYEDVKLNVDTLTDVVGTDISTFTEGDYVWCAFENKPVDINGTTVVWNWDIYRFTSNNFKIVNVTYLANVLTIECDRLPLLQAGNVIGIENASFINGFYEITEVSDRLIKINTTIVGWVSPFEYLSQVLTYNFVSVRSNSIDDINASMPTTLKDGEQVWVDNNGQGLFTVYKNNKVFKSNTFNNFNSSINSHFGQHVALSPNGQFAAITVADDIVYTYTKDPSSTTWIPNAQILPDITRSDSVGLEFGNNIAFSPDGTWIAISAAGASDVDGSGLTAQGYVGIYNRTGNNTYSLDSIITSQSPQANERFGSKVVIGNTVTDVSTSAITGTTTVYYMAVSAANKVYTYKNTVTITSNNITNITTNNESGWASFGTSLSVGSGNEFGYSISMSSSGALLAVSAPATSTNSGAVYIYKINGTAYSLDATINTSTVFDNTDASIVSGDRFGESLAVTPDGSKIIASAPFSNTLTANSGKVLVLNSTNYELLQVIFSNEKELNEHFGVSVVCANNTLAIFSANGDVEYTATLDVYSDLLDGALATYGTRYINDPLSPLTGFSTTFDNNSTRISNTQVDAGRVDIYDCYNTKYVYGESLVTSLNNSSQDDYGHSIALANNIILVGAPNESVNYSRDGKIYAYSRAVGKTSWQVLYQETLRPNAYKIKKSFIYDRTKNQLTSYIDVVDPIQGKIPGPADQELSYKTYFDPATYSFDTDRTVPNNSLLNYDDGMNWTKSQVGMLWWDLTRAKFIDNQCGNIVYRSSTWNKLYETASIDIYEWIETKYKPSEWDALSGTDKGDSLNITGKSRYGNSAYSVKKKYDSISQSFQKTYYYWVKNPTVAPDIIGRSLSAYNISRLISDPISEGYTCLALTGSNSFSLVNAANLIDGTNFNLTVQYWTVDMNYTTTNAHNQWKIVSEHPNTVLPLEIEKKWIHSLIGKDDNDRVVPDIKLPFKQRYGVGFRPRQSMFVNRVEALKQYIERVNSVLATKLLADDYDLSDLEQFDALPTASSGTWDITIDTDAELRFVGVATLEQAQLIPIIENGRIVGADIIKAGRGYVNAPYVSIETNTQGRNAILRTQINANGQVASVEVVNSGEGYLEGILETRLIVRPFTVLVISDSNTFNKWSTHTWNANTLKWDRSKGQSYDVTRYWKYIDWYATGYNQFTKIDYVVENTYELAILDVSINSIVKVNNIGTGGWLLLEKYNTLVTIDYTQNYKVIGRNNGTIQFSDILYNYGSIGFDSALFDSEIYDNLAEAELKIIIYTLRDKILVDELRVDYLKLFFASVRYALHEQTFIDWAFKTSFVKATHNVGSLKQKVNYNSDNLENFEDYIKEVKPYRTQVREYVSSYTGLDNSQTSVTDFDLLPTIDLRFNVTPVDVKINSLGEIESESPEILTYPWKHWYDHVGFTVKSIELVDGGAGYIENPVVKIEGGFGQGATANAYIANGKVNRIQLVSNGTGYLKAPTITIEGGLAIGGTAARASVIIESEVVRANKISIKFDRITKTYFISEITETESFTGTGSRLQWPLKFSPEIKIDKDCYVRVNGIDLLRDDYALSTKTSTARGYTSYSGLLTLTSAPEVGAVVEITYKKNVVHLSAADRINFYYSPESGMYGKDLAQLMTGIDYGGVNVTGLGFNISGGWDSLPWFTDSWDGFDSALDDYIVVVSTTVVKAGNFFEGRYYTIVSLGTTDWNAVAGTTNVTYTVGTQVLVVNNLGGTGTATPQYQSFKLPYTPSNGEKINVYISRYNPIASVNISSVIVSPLDTTSVWITTATPHNLTDNMFVRITGVTTGNYTGTYRIRQVIADNRFSITLDAIAVLGTGGAVIGYSYDPFIRIDDPDFVSYPMANKPNVVMDTIVGNGTTSIVNLPSLNLTINNGDKIIFRKSTSDGSFAPQPGEYDTQLSGGDLAYSSATGISPDDIILDGDGFVTPMTSAAPEEIVPGYITDAVAIKVYQLPTSGSAKIYFKNQYGNGVTNEFTIGQILNNFASIFVKIDNVILKQGIDYTVNWQAQTITLTVIPASMKIVSIISFGVAADNLMDTNYFVADGITSEYITAASWQLQELGSVVLVDGLAVSYELFNTSDSYDSPGKVGIRFGSSIAQGSLITYMITSDQNQAASIIRSETIAGNGLNKEFALTNPVGIKEPAANNVLVIQDGQILQPSVTEYFTLVDDLLNYALTTYKSRPYVSTPTDYKVYVDGIELAYGSDYIFDIAVMSVNLRKSAYKDGALLTVSSFANADYTIDSGFIRFVTAPPTLSSTEVISFFNHDVEEIQRTAEFTSFSGSIVPGSYDYYRYENLLGKRFKLNRTVAIDDYVWIIKNNQLLTHSIDYYLDSDLVTIKLKTALLTSDMLDVICFSDRIVNASYGYMQFKDMLNRVHYKRISKAKSTRLARDLQQKDLNIYLVDGNNLSSPNPALNLPGIIEINGERIEYFTKVGNVLGQLRRATLGTGAPALHRVRTIVLDIGPSETIPYKDRIISDTVISNGVDATISLNFTPSTFTTEYQYQGRAMTANETTTLVKNSVEVFASGYRLKKNNYTLFKESNGYPYSPAVPISELSPVGTKKEGDIKLAAEFTINNSSNNVTLTTAADEEAQVTVVKKVGHIWNRNDEDLTYANTDIANFIKNTETIFSQYLVDKYQYVLATDEGITLLTDDNEPLELD